MSDDTFVLCVDNRGYGVSLEQRKVYRAMSDPAAEKHAMIRVVDESSEDYLFPARLFVPSAASCSDSLPGTAPGRPSPTSRSWTRGPVAAQHP